MFRFIHAADIHLDSPLLKLEHYDGAPVEALRQATRRALKILVDLAIAEKVSFVLIAGDLYDRDWKDYNTGLFLVSQLTKLREAGINVYIISGNHDAANKITKTLRLPDNAFIFPADKASCVILKHVGVAIHGQSFLTPAVKKDLSAGYAPALPHMYNIGLLHTCATGREGHEPYAPCTVEGLLTKGYDYWALGHVHQQEVLHEDPYVVFPGNIQGRHIRETGAKGCMLVTVEDNGRTHLEFRPLDVIRWFRSTINIGNAETGYDCVTLIQEHLDELNEQNNLPLAVRIELRGTSTAHAELNADQERWTNEIRSTAIDSGNGQIWIEKVKFLTQYPAENELKKLTDGPVTELIHLIDEINSDPALLKTLGDSLSDFKKKMPRELKEAGSAVNTDNVEWLTEVLKQIKPMLLNRLLSKGIPE